MNLQQVKPQIDTYFDSKEFSRYFKEQYSTRTKRAQKLKETYSLRFIPKGKRFNKFFDSVEYGDKELLLFNYIARRGKLIEEEDWVVTYQWKEYIASSSSPFRNYSFKRKITNWVENEYRTNPDLHSFKDMEDMEDIDLSNYLLD